MNPLQEVSDPFTQFFENLGYEVTWDFRRSTGEKWYEVTDDDGLICQIDMNVPLADIIEDLTQMAKGKPGTSKSDYTINVEEGCPRFDLLLKRVAQSK